MTSTAPTRDQICAANPIDVYLANIGKPCKQSAGKHVCCCPFHDDKSPSMSVDVAKGVWFCHACHFGGSVIDLEIRTKGISVKQAMRNLAEAAHLINPADFEQPHKTATYEYKDALGRPVLKIDRIEMGLKKKFAQYHEDEKGNRINSIAGVQRVLYRMEKWAGEKDVELVEGEKCVHAMERIGYSATCNPGGSGAWCDAFASYLEGKNITIWPDNDEPGAKWTAAVLKSLESKAASLRVVRVPSIYGDVADMIDAQGDDLARSEVSALVLPVARVKRGASLPLRSSGEMWELYQKRVLTMDNCGVNLGKWLPSLNRCTRSLLPGDLAVFISDTGVGKTAALVNIAYSQRPLPVLFFQIELSPEPMCERFISRATGIDTLEVETRTRQGQVFDVDAWSHVYHCNDSRVDLEKMEDIIDRAELKIGRRPVLVLVDYVGLMAGGGGGKRYERMSTIAEGLKTLARSSETVIIMASQVKRDPERAEIDLHDAKDSGSVENSAQLVMGAWRPTVDTMAIKILKQTKRAGQVTINCSFNGDKQLIQELYYDAGGK